MEANHKMSLDYLGQKMHEVMCLFSLSLAALAVHAYSWTILLVLGTSNWLDFYDTKV